jgi:hypothetical protein
MSEGMTELRTRQEELWWHAPMIRYMRREVIKDLGRKTDWCAEETIYKNSLSMSNWTQEYVSPLRTKIRVLALTSSGWFLQPFHWLADFDSSKSIFKLNRPWRWAWGHLDDEKERTIWSDEGDLIYSPKPWITGPHDPELTPLDRMMYVSRDPRLMDPAEFDQTDESVKAHRFMCLAIDRLLQDEPEIPSIWRENGQLMVGWDPLPPEDGRLFPKEGECPYYTLGWLGSYHSGIHEWRWRAARTDLRYDGVYPSD